MNGKPCFSIVMVLLTSLMGIGGFAQPETVQALEDRGGFMSLDTPSWAEDSGYYQAAEPWWAEDSGSYEADTPWWAEDSEPYEPDDPWGTEDSGSYEPDDAPWWAEEPDVYERETPWWADDSGTYDDHDVPWWADSNCSGSDCEYERVWWQKGSECFGSLCDDPWNGSASDCSFGLCNDDSFLINCSYVTVSMYGAEGACESPMGQTQFDSCFPVSGTGTLSGQNQQTFRCSNAPGYQTGGYLLTDVASSSDEDVVLVLCTEGNMRNMVDRDSCVDAPSGIEYHTCQKDDRLLGPVGSDQDWFICEK